MQLIGRKLLGANMLIALGLRWGVTEENRSTRKAVHG